MGQLKPWQLVLIVIAIVAVTVSVYMSFGAAPQIQNMATESRMIDVNTGQIFLFSLGGKKAVTVPGENPDTGKPTLVPVVTDDAGILKIEPRSLPALQYLEGDLKAVVDRKTGEVKASDDKPRRVR
jgi:hypothetical protein